MLAFAAGAATAVATAQSVAEERLRESIVASERERGRSARELHDETLRASVDCACCSRPRWTSWASVPGSFRRR